MSATVDWLVCFAVREEAAFFKKPKRERIQCLITGMGRQNAENAVFEACKRFVPARVITTGFAGALNPGLEPGTVVFDPRYNLREVIDLPSLGARPATFHCAPRVVVTAAEKRLLWQETGADAVEMESQAIHEFCKRASLPAVTIRVISDGAHEDLPLDFNALMRADGRINWWKFAGFLARKPGLIPRLLAFQRRTRAAARNLGAVLSAVLEPSPTGAANQAGP